MCRSPTQCDYQTGDDEAQNNENFDTRKPEFKLAKDSDPKIVYENNEQKKDCNPHTGIDFVTTNPISVQLTMHLIWRLLDYQSGSCQSEYR